MLALLVYLGSRKVVGREEVFVVVPVLGEGGRGINQGGKDGPVRWFGGSQFDPIFRFYLGSLASISFTRLMFPPSDLPLRKIFLAK